MLAMDFVSLLFGALVVFLGIVIYRFSKDYLQGDPNQPRFQKSLLLVLGLALVATLTDHLIVFGAAWTGITYAIRPLLLYFPNRPQAQLATRKKFNLSLISDGLFFVSIALLFKTTGSFEIHKIREYTQNPMNSDTEQLMLISCVILVCSAIVRSAQIPFHGWLLQVMETPTPVSALLHAGVVNLGGVLLLKLLPLIGMFPLAQGILVIVGMLNVILASLVYLTRITIKVKLAWSTVAQIGFFFVEIGLGYSQLALMHLLFHSLYKAHSFLSSGSVVNQYSKIITSAAMDLPNQNRGTSYFLKIMLAGTMGLGLVFGLQEGVKWFLESKQNVEWLPQGALVVMGLSLAPLILPIINGMKGILRKQLKHIFLFMFALITLHLVFPSSQTLMGFSSHPGLEIAWILGFSALFLFQWALLCFSQNGFFQKAYPFIYHGYYLDELLNRLLHKKWMHHHQQSISLESPVTSTTRVALKGAPHV
jgi:NAD(P)H-quinone oxidoreductase subunit 5